MESRPTRPAWRSAMQLAAALALLNVSVTIVSVWPTLAVRPSRLLSVDLALLVLALVAIGGAGRIARRWLAAVWVILVFARYVDISVRSLYGRGVNLYFDLTLVPDVGAMFAYVAQPRLLGALAVLTILVPLAIYVPSRWAIGRVADAAAAGVTRAALGVLATIVVIAGVVVPAPEGAARTGIATPVVATITGEVMEFWHDATVAAKRPLAPAPDVSSDLSAVRGADVLLVFVESYGVTSWERPAFVRTLDAPRERLRAAIADTSRAVVSGLVTSTTFGGESWLAHISLLSGTEVRDADINRRLMAERRDTLVTTFSRAGYSTTAIMPGLHAPWPEGRFYGFDRIFGAPDLGYEGPPFGWWDVTDQFIFAKLDAMLLAPHPRRPAFVFMPTISTHAPFTPVPPFQPDWSRMLTPSPYDTADLERAYDVQPDWTDLGPGYADALAYTTDTLASFLRRRADLDLVMVVLGDHQPPALVSGEGASWDVPVHVIASRAAVLDRLRGRGFIDGLTPPREPLTRMDGLLPFLLDAFGGAPAAPDPGP
ncbi:MAG: sulfatase-like hydrolase/transferase [Acidobacteria bacterium]|nr:sulfatase-like hydrolase/transferase [Acidobacteriota bacterium]